MHDPIRDQLEQFVSPQLAELVSGMARMAAVLLTQQAEIQRLKAELEDPADVPPLCERGSEEPGA